ncbi:hypothetical protein ACOSQ2_010988 [Xanthoceras sorbifolium]
MTQVVSGCVAFSKTRVSQADKGKGIISQASGNDTGPISIEVHPSMRKATWKRHARACNDSYHVEMEDPGSLNMLLILRRRHLLAGDAASNLKAAERKCLNAARSSGGSGLVR